MKATFLISLYASLFATRLAAANPVTLHIDNTHSSIQFTVPFLGISEVTGRFEGFCGNIVFDGTNPVASQLELFIDASSINTGLKIRDRDLVEKYLETKSHPIIYFKSRSIHLSKPKYYEVIGDLTLHGVARELKITLTIIGDIINDEKAREIGFKLQPLKLNRTAFGILEGSMGSGSVGDTVTVSSVIRVRDVTPYRSTLDKQFPEKQSTISFPFTGTFQGPQGERIKLIQDKEKYFIAYSDNEWNWFAEARMVGPNLFKLLSFSHLVEIKGMTISFKALTEKEKVFKIETN